MQEILLKIKYFERGSLKTLKKVTDFFFYIQFLLMNERVLELVTSLSSSYKTCSENFLDNFHDLIQSGF